MTRDDSVKVPFIDIGNRSIETGAILVRIADTVPDDTALAFSMDVAQGPKDLGQDTGGCRLSGLAELLICRVVEDQISLNECPGRLVVKDNFLVGVRGNVFIFELCVEFRVDSDFLVLGENDTERNLLVSLLLTLLWETFGTNDFGLGIGSVPRAKEHVMLIKSGYGFKVERGKYVENLLRYQRR